MTDLTSAVAALRRPRLLIHAARNGLADYDRERDLRRLTRQPQALAPDQALRRLMDEEGRVEAHRRDGVACYSMTRHIELLIALMAEAAALGQSHRPV